MCIVTGARRLEVRVTRHWPPTSLGLLGSVSRWHHCTPHQCTRSLWQSETAHLMVMPIKVLWRYANLLIATIMSTFAVTLVSPRSAGERTFITANDTAVTLTSLSLLWYHAGLLLACWSFGRRSMRTKLYQLPEPCVRFVPTLRRQQESTLSTQSSLFNLNLNFLYVMIVGLYQVVQGKPNRTYCRSSSLNPFNLILSINLYIGVRI